jgi:hypothetical protein
VIVRISGEGQFDLPDDLRDELNELDNDTVAAVEGADEAKFTATYGALLNFVRDRGTPHDDEDLHGSDLILPPSDLSLAEAEEQFTGEGLLPD